MSAFRPTLDPFERRRVEVAVAGLRDSASQVAAVASRLASEPPPSLWVGGARRRHDGHIRTLVSELLAVAAMLRDVADDAAAALAAAVRAAELEAFTAHAPAGSGAGAGTAGVVGDAGGATRAGPAPSPAPAPAAQLR